MTTNEYYKIIELKQNNCICVRRDDSLKIDFGRIELIYLTKFRGCLFQTLCRAQATDHLAQDASHHRLILAEYMKLDRAQVTVYNQNYYETNLRFTLASGIHMKCILHVGCIRESAKH